MYVPFRRSVKLNFIIVSSQKFLYLCFDLGHNLRNNISRTFTVLRAHRYESTKEGSVLGFCLLGVDANAWVPEVLVLGG